MELLISPAGFFARLSRLVRATEYRLATLTLVLLLALPTNVPAQVAETAGLVAGMQAIQEARKAIASAIQYADDVTKARLAEIDARLGIRMRQFDELMQKNLNHVENISHDVLDKLFRESNEILFSAMRELQDQTVDLDFRANNLLLNAIRGITAVPFVNVDPFIATYTPSYLVPGKTGDYRVEVLGFFQQSWGVPQYQFPDGKWTDCAVSQDNRVFIPVPADKVRASTAKTLVLKFRFPTEHHYLWPNSTSTRDLWVTVLPSVVAHYEIISAKANPDWVYDMPQLTIPFNFNAEAGEDKSPETVASLEDLARNPAIKADFVNVYNLNQSKIESVWLTDEGGNNPTGDNKNSVLQGSGQLLQVRHRVHGKPGNWFGNGAGANVSGTIHVQLRLARMRQAESWSLEGSAPVGDLKWGESSRLAPKASPQDPQKPLETLLLRLEDASFDPPLRRTLSLREAYRSKFVTVESKPDRLEIAVRSFPRQ